MNGGDEQNRQFDREHEHQTNLGPDERHNDERYSVRGPCAYELIEGEGKEAAVVHYGTAYSLNVSADGILLCSIANLWFGNCWRSIIPRSQAGKP